ncbi:MAG TPA: TonB-dependent receptor [Bryobacteraceae bacterium]
MRSFSIALCVLLIAPVVFAQSDRGAITGAISDPAGAVVSNAGVEAKHIETGTVYQAASSSTGNYTLSQLPAGTYSLSVTVPGFKQYVRQGILVEVAQVLRIDVNLAVGATSESVTVTEAAPLLRTESGEVSYNVTSQTLDELPIVGIGAAQASSSGIRNPLAVGQLLPGVTYSGANNLTRVNGSPSNTYTIWIEGQDATSGYLDGFSQHTQPGMDAIQEVSIQTSNYAAEYGQVGGGFFNMTMKSGSNQFHGSLYDYFVNEALNASTPFVNINPVQRRNDYGFTLGGPVWIPKVYNGHNKTFFFLNWEQFREVDIINTLADTVPIAAYRTGNFSQVIIQRVLGTDPLGRQIIQGTIYDPATERLAPNGQIVRDPFPGNIIPPNRLDPVALRIQAMIPLPQGPNASALVNNGIYPFVSPNLTSIPSFKIDHSLSSKAKLAVYASETGSRRPNSTGGGQADGLPIPITAAKSMYIYSQTERLNFDYTLKPTLLLHLGAGYVDHRSTSIEAVTDYNPSEYLELNGIPINRTFPKIQGLTAAQGGMNIMGPNDGAIDHAYLPTFNASLTWVKNNHTYKFGSEFRPQGYSGLIYTNTSGFFNFAADQTSLPSTLGQNLGGGTIGFPYASFLLGAVQTVNVTQPPDFRVGKQAWGFFAQDTWKITRRITLDYGLRYDYSGYFKEEHGRLLNFSSTTPNPSAGGLPGAVIFEGSGPGHCNCDFAHVYPWAFGPRLGLAYQINSKTVLRAGWGIVYSPTPDVNGLTGALQLSAPVGAPAFGEAVMILANGVPPADVYSWPNFAPGQFPKVNSLNSPPIAIDPNAGRPARQYQWSIGLQREILRDLAVEASYVGNRGIWWNGPGLINLNANTPQRLAAFGLNETNSADLSLLASPLNSALAVQRGFSNAPYPGFPISSTVAQALRPYSQFGTLTTMWSPLGDTWYDALQVKATKRFSHGLSSTTVFAWHKQLVIGASSSSGGAPVNDVFNRAQNKYISQYDQPLTFNTAVSYVVPALKTNKVLSSAARDWTVGAYLAYGSGLPIEAPTSNNALASSLFRSTFANRVPGQPLFTQDINCHCFDPNKTFVLNPAAWTDPPAGTFGSSAAYYSDYRGQRRPTENANFGRTVRIRERASLNVRAEFTNVFNRTEVNNPTSTNAGATQTRNSAGQTTGGFGWINTTSVLAPPRAGTLIARFQF